MSKDSRINLGAKVKCKITGYQGIVTSRAECLNGCWRYSVHAPVDQDGKIPDSYWMDEDALEVIDPEVIPHKPVTTGGPMTRSSF